MFDSIDSNEDKFSAEVIEAMNAAVFREIDEAYSTSASMDSETSLSDHGQILERLGKRAGVPDADIKHVRSIIEDRISQVQEDTSEAPSPTFTGKQPKEDDAFDNAALENLFQPLARR
jgi:hypothetical protein